MAQNSIKTNQQDKLSDIVRLLNKSKHKAVAIDALTQLIADDEQLEEGTQQHVDAALQLSQEHRTELNNIHALLNDFFIQEQGN